MPKLSNRVHTFTDSVIRRMTRISDEHGAINLSQGFPDFDPPKPILDALAKAAYEGPHQSSVTFGAENFREALAIKQGRAIGRTIDPNNEICVTCGGTEAMMATMMTICNPGDKVLVFSPFYENYGVDAILSGAEYVVSPALDEGTVKLCNRYAVPCMPGVMTLKDVITALELGCDVIKLFPGEAFGPGMVKAIKGPLPRQTSCPPAV